MIKFFPIDSKVNFIDIGSRLEIYQKDARYRVVGESWGETNEKVYLRQDLNLLFQNGFLVKRSYPWKEQTAWLINKIQIFIDKASVYNLISYHHAEIHKNDVITSQQIVTNDRLYAIYFQNNWEFFRDPQNARQKEQQDQINLALTIQRKELLELAIKELNINQGNYEIFDLDTFSLNKESRILKDKDWEKILGGVWEGIYREYVLGFSDDELSYFSPPMPWILVDKNATHLLILLQKSNRSFEKLLMEI